MWAKYYEKLLTNSAGKFSAQFHIQLKITLLFNRVLQMSVHGMRQKTNCMAQHDLYRPQKVYIRFLGESDITQSLSK